MAKRVQIRINLRFLEDYDRLGTNIVKDKDYEDSPFPIRKDVFMLAATCGFLKDQEEENGGASQKSTFLYAEDTSNTTWCQNSPSYIFLPHSGFWRIRSLLPQFRIRSPLKTASSTLSSFQQDPYFRYPQYYAFRPGTLCAGIYYRSPGRISQGR